jgi:peptidoglycan/LPS O-acetylase OafA/YrhL
LGLLRILLAVCVFCGHSEGMFGSRLLDHLPWLAADLAVELFFVVSGFYMQLILSTRYTRAKLGKAWLSQFYKARYFRLLPIYLLGSLLVVGGSLLRLTFAPLAMWGYVWALPRTPGNVLFKAFLYLTNATMFFQDLVVFFAIHGRQIHWSGNFFNSDAPLYLGLAIPQAWSLGIELSFYFIAPYLLNLRSRWLILGACCSLAAKLIAIEALHLGDPWTYRFFPFELGYFLVGALAFRYRSWFDRPVPPRIGKYCVYPLAIAFTAVSVRVPLPTLVYPMAIACILPFMFRMTSELRADRLIGDLSYPFYIFHLFALTLSAHVTQLWWSWPRDSLAWVGLGLTLALSAIGLALEIRFVEPWRVRLAEQHALHS